MKPHQDNVFVMFEPEPTMTAGGLHIPQQVTNKTRWARVVAVGPGYYTSLGKFVPNTVQVGQLALVDRLAGQDYAWDLTIPRHNKKGCEWGDDEASFRAVREGEIMAVRDAEDEEELPSPHDSLAPPFAVAV